MFASHPKVLPVLWQPSLHLCSFVISRMVYNGMSVHTLFDHSPVEVLLVYSQHFAIKNKTVMNICVQGCMYISLRYMPKNELPGLCGKGIFIFIRNLPTLPERLYHFTFPSAIYERYFIFSASCQHLLL